MRHLLEHNKFQFLLIVPQMPSLRHHIHDKQTCSRRPQRGSTTMSLRCPFRTEKQKPSPSCLDALYASVVTCTISNPASKSSCVTKKPPPTAHATPEECWSYPMELKSAMTSSNQMDALTPNTSTSTSVSDVETQITELSSALAARKLRPHTPLHAGA